MKVFPKRTYIFLKRKGFYLENICKTKVKLFLFLKLFLFFQKSAKNKSFGVERMGHHSFPHCIPIFTAAFPFEAVIMH